jgi:hypothetical protein
MDFLEEYDEMYTIPSKIAVTYKFLQLFTVALEDTATVKRGLHFSTIAVDSNLSDEILLAFNAYLKAKKKQLKKFDQDTINCGKILWFFYQKLLEVGAFTAEVRTEIRGYMDLCEYIIL